MALHHVYGAWIVLCFPFVIQVVVCLLHGEFVRPADKTPSELFAGVQDENLIRTLICEQNERVGSSAQFRVVLHCTLARSEQSQNV